MKVKQTVTLPSDDLEWYHNEYPGGNLSWILTLLLHAFRQTHHDTGVTPRGVIRDSAKEVKEMINEGIFDKEETERD